MTHRQRSGRVPGIAPQHPPTPPHIRFSASGGWTRRLNCLPRDPMASQIRNAANCDSTGPCASSPAPRQTKRRDASAHSAASTQLRYPQAPQCAASTPHTVPTQPEALPYMPPNPALQRPTAPSIISRFLGKLFHHQRALTPGASRCPMCANFTSSHDHSKARIIRLIQKM